MDQRTSVLGGQRVLVTGGTGFIGSHLVQALVEHGAEVHILARSRPGGSRSRGEPEGAHVHLGDIVDRGSVDAAVRTARPEVVFHLAGYTHAGRSWQEPAECVRTNIEGTANLLAALERRGCARLVHASTAEVYGDNVVPLVESAVPRPASPYAVSKHAAELLCQLGAERRGWPIVQLRLFNAYGPGQAPDRIIPEIITRALAGTELRMTRGNQTREFNHVLDLVEGLLLAAVVEQVDGELVNLGGGEEISIAALASTLLDLLGNPIEAQLGALPERPVEIERVCADTTKARELLGWTSRRTLREGLAETIAWYRAQADGPVES